MTMDEQKKRLLNLTAAALSKSVSYFGATYGDNWDYDGNRERAAKITFPQ